MREAVKKKALELAKEKGKLTYDDLNEILPADTGSGDISKDIDEMMVMLSGMDIDVVDDLRVDAETRQVEQQKEKQAKRAETRRDAAQSRLERADDPVRRYLREVKIEMGKVTWPSRPEVVQSTSVVIVAVAIAAAYIGLLDLIWSSLVKLVRLG